MKFKMFISLIVAFFLFGCSDSEIKVENGTYTFKYLEYYESNERKTIDCTDMDSIDIKKQTTCKSKGLKITIEENYYTLSMTEGHLVTGYYKLNEDKIIVSSSQDGEYKYTGWLHYRNGKIYYGINQVYIVLDN